MTDHPDDLLSNQKKVKRKALEKAWEESQRARQEQLEKDMETFVQYFTGEIVETVNLMKQDGLSISLSTAHRYVNHPLVISMLDDKFSKPREAIASNGEIQEFLTDVMRSKGEGRLFRFDGGVRMKATELLGKSRALFVDKSENLNLHLHLTAKDILDQDLKVQYLKDNPQLAADALAYEEAQRLALQQQAIPVEVQEDPFS